MNIRAFKSPLFKGGVSEADGGLLLGETTNTRYPKGGYKIKWASLPNVDILK
jgi:hypothetical protein